MTDDEAIIAALNDTVAGLEAERDRLRITAHLATVSADGAAEAVGAMAAKMSALTAERELLRDVIEHAYAVFSAPDADQDDRTAALGMMAETLDVSREGP